MKRLIYGVLVVIVLSLGVYIVNAATPDTNAPTLNSISIKNPKTSYNVGDKIYLNMDANDDISGINEISVGITAIEKDNIEDSVSGVTASVYDFDNSPYIEIPSNLPNGKYQIDQIYLTDNAGNWTGFTNFKELEGINELHFINYDLIFNIKAENNDTTSPVLKSITIDKNKYKYGEKIKISADASDDKSGIKVITAYFNLDNSEKTWNCELRYNSKTNRYEGTLETPVYNGKYYLNAVDLTDNNGNSSGYVREEKVISNVEFEVTDAPTLSEPIIKIDKIDFNYKKLTPPTIFKLRIKLDSSAQMFDKADVVISQNKNNAKEIRAFLTKDNDGYLSGYVDISQFSELGVYYLQDINIYTTLDWYAEEFIEKANKSLEYDKVALFELTNDNSYDVVTSTTDKELISKIKNAKNDAKIAISSTSSPIVKKEVFKAIKDTNKTIYIESNGIQWVFNGNNITKPKNIDVATSINYIYNDELNNTLADYLGNSIVINFAENGKLPGIALIRVKTDYALRNYLGIEDLNVYYYNENNNKMFNNVAQGINMTEDGYLEFNIDHNSTFIISNKKVDEKYVSDDVTDLALNDENVKVVKEKQENNKNSRNILLFASIGAAIALIITVTTIILIHKKKKK